MSVQILVGDVRDRLADLPDDHFDCVLTSPPYWGLRSYLDADHPDKHLEIGCEPTLGEHLEVIVGVMAEVRRVLKPSGVAWVNYGDCYATTPNGRSASATKAAGGDDRTFRDKPFSTVGPIYEIQPESRQAARRGRSGNLGNGGINGVVIPDGRVVAGGYLKAKDLCMVPQRLAIALQEDGWWVRSILPWVKRNGMPESISDRPASSIEYVIMLTKSARYAYDAEAVRRAASLSTNARVAQNVAAQAGGDRANGGAKSNGSMKAVVRGSTPKSASPGSGIKANESFHAATSAEVLHCRNFRNSDLFFDSLDAPFSLISAADGTPLALDVCPQGFKEAHFATFPEALALPLLRAGCPKYTCAMCGAVVDSGVEKNVRAFTDGRAVHPMRGDLFQDAVGGGAKPVLQQVMQGRVHAGNASNGAVPVVRGGGDSRPEGAPTPILQHPLRVNPHREEQGGDEGVVHDQQGLYRDAETGSSGRVESGLCAGAQVGNGEATGPLSSEDGGRAPSGRKPVEQRGRKPRAAHQNRTRQTSEGAHGQDHMSALRDPDPSIAACPNCNADLCRVGAIIPGRILDPFGGAGTVGLVADRLGMDCTLIELNPDSAAITRKRIDGDGGMFSAVETITSPAEPASPIRTLFDQLTPGEAA